MVPGLISAYLVSGTCLITAKWQYEQTMITCTVTNLYEVQHLPDVFSYVHISICAEYRAQKMCPRPDQV